MKEIKERNGMEYLLPHLEEIDEDPNVRYDFNLLEEVYSIDLDNPKKFYRHLFYKNLFRGKRNLKATCDNRSSSHGLH